jgi:hypothetical protein
LTNQHALKHKEKSRDVIDAEKAAAQAKLDAMRASAKDVEIRRQAHDMVSPGRVCSFPFLRAFLILRTA